MRHARAVEKTIFFLQIEITTMDNVWDLEFLLKLNFDRIPFQFHVLEKGIEENKNDLRKNNLILISSPIGMAKIFISFKDKKTKKYLKKKEIFN